MLALSLAVALLLLVKLGVACCFSKRSRNVTSGMQMRGQIEERSQCYAHARTL